MLKTIFNCKLHVAAHFAIGCLLVCIAGAGIQVAHGAEPLERTTQRLAQVVDYVAADYSGAVRDGQIIEASEWKEQRELLSEARKLIADLPGSAADRSALALQVAQVAQAVDARAADIEVLRRCRAVRQTLKDVFGLRMLPTRPVDVAHGAKLYATLCTSCHGTSGRADTPAAAALKPPPLSFHDAERMKKVAPALAFHALTFGVAGTAMLPFDQLGAPDRWDLAFYVVGLRHGQALAATKAPAALSRELQTRLRSLAVLSELSDEELSSELQSAGVSAPAQNEILAYLRTVGAALEPASGGAGRFAQARALVSETLTAAERQDFVAAHKLAIAAYLDGMEPYEASLRIEQPALLGRIEQAFSGLRQASDPDYGPSAAEVKRQTQIILALLIDAESMRDGDQPSSTKAFLASLLIALREGLEVALLIAALLSFVRKSGQAHLVRSVHIGWLLSVPAGLCSFALFGKLIDGQSRELAEGVLTLIAAAILLSVTHVVLGAKEARHWLGFLRRHIEAVGSSCHKQMPALWLAGIAFFAAYREALETALFYRALLLDAGRDGWRPVLLGIAVGVLALVFLVGILSRIGRKLNPRPVMLASSVLLALLALSLTGHGIHSLQEGGYLSLRLFQPFGQSWSGLPTLGIYPNWQGLLGQLTMLALLFLPSLLNKIKAARTASPPGPLPAPFGA